MTIKIPVMQNKGQTYPIGIDLGPGNLFAAQLESSGKGLRIREAMHRELNEGSDGEPLSDNALPDLLTDIRKNMNFRGKRVVLRLDSPQVFSFPLQFQAEKDEDPEQAILRESSSHIPFDLGEAVIDYSCLKPLSNEEPIKYACIVVATKRDYVEHCLSTIKKTGLDVEVMEYGASSLIRLHDYLAGMPDDPVILCYLGWRQTMISFASKDRIYAERHLPWGLGICVDKLKRNLVHDDKRARHLLARYGLKYWIRDKLGLEELQDLDPDTLRAVHQIIISPLEKLVHEFHRLFAYIRSEERQIQFKGTMLYGHLEVIEGLENYLADRINLPVHKITLTQHIKTGLKCRLPESEIGSGFALALGLCLRKLPWL